MLDLSLPEFFVACGSILLATLLLTEIFDCTNIFAPIESQLPIVSLEASNAWKVLYPERRNKSEYAINIETRGAIVVQPSEPLKWTGYCAQPLAMTMANDGNTVTVTGLWSQNTRPIIEGGPLSESYEFHSMLFHWGPNDESGSKHIVNGIHYPLELQLIHVKRGFDSPVDAIISGAKHGVAIVSIFYQIASVDNRYLDHVARNLWCIPRSEMKVSIAPFPLKGLFSPFENNYYTYNDSPPRVQQSANELLTWIIQPQSSNVSSSQVGKFRSIYLADVPIPLDSRSNQRLNDRELYYYD